MLNTWTCIEAGNTIWNIWQINHKKEVYEWEQLTVPMMSPEWDPRIIAPFLKGKIRGRKILFVLNIAQTFVRLTDSPFTEVEEPLIISKGEMNWQGAVFAKIPACLVEMCCINKVKQKRILAIDTMEHRLACYFSKLYTTAFWILIPQEPGIRLVALLNGKPNGCYFFSNDFQFRIIELTRIYLCQQEAPLHAAIFSDDPAFEWIREFLTEKSVKIVEGDFKREMIEEWVKI